jgi:hypothetical protein
VCKWSEGIFILDHNDFILSFQANPSSNSFIGYFNEFNFAINEAAVFVEELSEQYLLNSHIRWRFMIPRVAYKNVLYILTLIDLKCIV